MGSLAVLAANFGHILYFIILPIFVLAGTGFALQRKLGLDMPTLGRLNFHYAIPALIYCSVVGAQVDGSQIADVIVFNACLIGVMTFVGLGVWRVTGAAGDQRNAIILAAILYNAGNVGLPLQELAFRAAGLSEQAMSLQAFAVVTQNLTTFTFGVFLASGGGGQGGLPRLLRDIARFPPVYALSAGIVTVLIRRWLGQSAPAAAQAMQPFWQAIVYAKNAVIPVALVTLGAQLALVRVHGHGGPVGVCVGMRLLLGPAISVGLLWLLGIRGFTAQVLFIGAAAPTAVNAMLMCMQFKNHPEFMSRVVFWATLLSPATLTVVVYVAQSGLIPILAAP